MVEAAASTLAAKQNLRNLFNRSRSGLVKKTYPFGVIEQMKQRKVKVKVIVKVK